MILIFEIIIFFNKKKNLLFNCYIYLFLNFFKLLKIIIISFLKVFFIASYNFNKKYHNNKKFNSLCNIFSKPILKKSIIITHKFPLVNLSNFWIHYQEKEKVEFFLTENYGNVSSIKYDLRFYPFWIFWLFKIDLTKFFNKIPKFEILPILKKLEFFIWLIKVNYTVYKFIFNYDFKINLTGFKIIKLIKLIFVPVEIIDTIFIIFTNSFNHKINLINFMIYIKFYELKIKSLFFHNFFVYLKNKQKNYENFLNHELIKIYLLIRDLSEFLNFSFLNFIYKLFYKYIYIFISYYSFIFLIFFKHLFLNIIDKLIPYIIKLIKFIVISIFEPFIKINFWKNYFHLKMEIIKIKIINFYNLLELLKINLIKKN